MAIVFLQSAVAARLCFLEGAPTRCNGAARSGKAGGLAYRRSVQALSSRSRGGNRGEENLEQYLEEMSLEYESVWDTKPRWCQPWTIVLTGTLAVVSVWRILDWVPATLAVSVLVAAWWFVFLYSYPREYRKMISERKRETEAGETDTYGREKT